MALRRAIAICSSLNRHFLIAPSSRLPPEHSNEPKSAPFMRDASDKNREKTPSGRLPPSLIDALSRASAVFRAPVEGPSARTHRNDSGATPLLIEGIVKRFGTLTAVDGIALEVRDRECLGLIGPNGAGKSTLIRCIVGRALPDSGTALLFGEPADSPGARAALGWVPQELALYPLLTSRENLEFFGRYQGLSGPALREAVRWCLDWSALAERSDEVVKKLSGGMKRRLNMACGLIHRPRVVLMDEPTVGVDPQSRNRIFDMIEALRAEGMAVVYTTHYMEEAERLCDRIAVVDHGKIIALGTKEELVRDAFGGQSEILVRFASGTNVSAWAESREGRMEGDVAHFTVARPTAVAELLDAAGRAGFDVADVILRRPNLESLFLRLTGRDLRE